MATKSVLRLLNFLEFEKRNPRELVHSWWQKVFLHERVDKSLHNQTRSDVAALRTSTLLLLWAYKTPSEPVHSLIISHGIWQLVFAQRRHKATRVFDCGAWGGSICMPSKWLVGELYCFMQKAWLQQTGSSYLPRPNLTRTTSNAQ